MDAELNIILHMGCNMVTLRAQPEDTSDLSLVHIVPATTADGTMYTKLRTEVSSGWARRVTMSQPM
jgi:hypothetical protein